ncbi:unnamed protein product, partial [Didymodactylos carnosus]
YEVLDKQCLSYSYICPWGKNCNDKTDKHLLNTVHIPPKMYSGENKCLKMINEMIELR